MSTLSECLHKVLSEGTKIEWPYYLWPHLKGQKQSVHIKRMSTLSGVLTYLGAMHEPKRMKCVCDVPYLTCTFSLTLSPFLGTNPIFTSHSSFGPNKKSTKSNSNPLLMTLSKGPKVTLTEDLEEGFCTKRVLMRDLPNLTLSNETFGIELKAFNDKMTNSEFIFS